MEKKISFGFSKVSKKSNLILGKQEQKDEKNKIELIKCLEGQEIHLVEEKKEEVPLIIPLKGDQKNSAALLSLRIRQAVLAGEEIVEKKKETIQKIPIGQGPENLNNRAARELLAEVYNVEEDNSLQSALVLPLKNIDLPLEGAKESSIDDYESIPISQFGKAMLRGMGWKEEPKPKAGRADEGPVLRPKGMGLGADKALKSKTLLIPPEVNEVLEIKKGAFVLILGGKNKDLYGQIEGLDDHAGRVIVKMALGGAKESFNEFMVQPVSKKEYVQYSKCINSAKYDEYKRMKKKYDEIEPKRERINNEHNKQSEETYLFKDKAKETLKYNENSKNKIQNHEVHKTEFQYYTPDINNDEYASTSRQKNFNQTTQSIHKSDSQSSSESFGNRIKSSKSKRNKESKERRHKKRYSSNSSSDEKKYKKNKKKSKKSKRERSRSRSKARR